MHKLGKGQILNAHSQIGAQIKPDKASGKSTYKDGNKLQL